MSDNLTPFSKMVSDFLAISPKYHMEFLSGKSYALHATVHKWASGECVPDSRRLPLAISAIREHRCCCICDDLARHIFDGCLKKGGKNARV